MASDEVGQNSNIEAEDLGLDLVEDKKQQRGRQADLTPYFDMEINETTNDGNTNTINKFIFSLAGPISQAYQGP